MTRACSLRNCSISDLWRGSREKDRERQESVKKMKTERERQNKWINKGLWEQEDKAKCWRQFLSEQTPPGDYKRIERDKRFYFEVTHMLHFSSCDTFLCSSWLWALQVAILDEIRRQGGREAQSEVLYWENIICDCESRVKLIIKVPVSNLSPRQHCLFRDCFKTPSLVEQAILHVFVSVPDLPEHYH